MRELITIVGACILLGVFWSINYFVAMLTFDTDDEWESFLLRIHISLEDMFGVNK